MASGEDRWDVFLAHAAPDKPRARILHQALTALGLRVFLDEVSLRPGDDWRTAITRALRASDVIVALVSPHTASGHYEGEELAIAMAQAGDTRVVPIHLAADLAPPYGFARLNRIDWEDEADVASVVTRLRRVIPRAVRGEATGAAIFSHRIPVPPRRLTGREDLLERLAANLDAGRTTTLTQTIQGMGGVGKTMVAAALCEAQRDRYDIVWWVRAEDQSTLVADLAELADEVGVNTGQGGNADAEAVVRWLETTDRRWLLVFDDVPDRDAIVPWLPSRGPGAAVITSRYRHMDELGAVEPIDLLSPVEAEGFLRDRAPRAAAEDLGPTLERIGGLPLALEQAAAWVDRKPNRTFARWVELFDAADGRAFSHRLVDHDHTATTTWQVSVVAAAEEAPLAERLLGALGHLASEGVGIQWLREAADDPYLDARPADVDAAMDALDSYHLVSIASDDTVDVHRIVQDVARRTAPDGAGPFAVRAIAAQDPGGFAPGVWPLLSVLAPHARQAAAVLVAGDMPGETALVALLSRIAVVASERGEVQEAIETATTAVAAARAATPDSATSLIADDALARARQALGPAGGAGPLLEQILADSVRILGPDHPDTLTSRNNLASTYLAEGDAERAIPLLEATLQDLQRILGPDNPTTLASRANLAVAYANIGDHERAIFLLEATLADRRAVLGPHHPDTLATQNAIARAYLAIGDVQRAIPLLEATLDDLQQVLGPAHPTTLASRNNLAVAYGNIGDHHRAVALLEATLADRRTVFGPDHPDTLATQSNLAVALLTTGDAARAAELLDETVAARERILGPDHPATIASRDLRLTAGRELARNVDRDDDPGPTG